MSRKWERMVQKNSKMINEKRTKKGHALIGNDDMIRGRSWVFPLTLVIVGVVFLFTIPPGSGALYYITAALYVLLAVFHYYVRRPYIKISKNELSWRTFTGIKFIKADKIQFVRLNDFHSEVVLKDGKTRRTFTKFFHLYPMEQLNRELRKFATTNQIMIVEQ